MNHYSESDTRSKFIDPFLYDAWWSEDHIIREWAFTDGRKLPWNKRGKQCFADYVLKYQGVQLAIIEAKKYGLAPTEGLEQVKEYGNKLHIRWVYSSNGQKIYEFDLEEWIGKYIDTLPSPSELYERVIDPTATLRHHLLSTPYCLEANKRPRYYQDIAVSQVLTSISLWQQRILLTLATGTGKTFIAFQIAYKLFMAKWSLQGINRRPRILFLADRNILITQAMNTFNALEKDLLWVTGKEIKKRHGVVPTNANIFFAIYQAIIWGSDEDGDSSVEWIDDTTWYYRNYDPGFFDLIIIDECHRGGADTNGNRHAILKHFSSAIQLGMTATPKRNDNVDTYDYFGKPVYEYSLKEGINDGFLTPYKVKRIWTNMEELVINSEVEIVTGEAKKDIYTISDFDRVVIVPERTDLVCQEILRHIGTFDKTIIFCVDQDHALRTRDSINAHKTVKDPDYCVRVTSKIMKRRYRPSSRVVKCSPLESMPKM
jgi:type I restriction enzyme, R subunit